MDGQSKGIQLSLLCLLILGLLPIIATTRTNDGNALAFAFWLSLWQTVFAVPVFWVEKKRSPPTDAAAKNSNAFGRVQTWALVVLTGTLFGAATFAYVFAVDQTGPITFAVAVQAYPLFALLWESLFLRKRKSAPEIAFTLVIAAAMVYLGTQGTWDLSSISGGFWLALVVPLLWSIAHVIIKEMMNAAAITPSEVIVTRVLIATLLLGFAGLLMQGSEGLLTGLHWKFQLVAFLMGFAYYLELFSWFTAVKYIDVSKGASITAPAPAVTVLLALVLLGQELQHYQVTALVLVVVSVVGLIRCGSK